MTPSPKILESPKPLQFHQTFPSPLLLICKTDGYHKLHPPPLLQPHHPAQPTSRTFTRHSPIACPQPLCASRVHYTPRTSRARNVVTSLSPSSDSWLSASRIDPAICQARTSLKVWKNHHLDLNHKTRIHNFPTPSLPLQKKILPTRYTTSLDGLLHPSSTLLAFEIYSQDTSMFQLCPPLVAGTEFFQDVNEESCKSTGPLPPTRYSRIEHVSVYWSPPPRPRGKWIPI